MTEKKLVACHDLEGNTVNVPAAELNFRPSLYGVIIKEGKVLLAGYDDGWDYPGGGLHKGETFDEAFTREIKEETGLSIARGKLLDVASDFFTHPTDGHCQTILLYFVGEYAGGEISTEYFDENEKVHGKKAEWFDIEQLHLMKFYNPLSPAQNQALARLALEHKRI